MKTKASSNVFAKESNKLAGGLIPRQLSDQLAISALFHQTSRSEIIRSLLAAKLKEDNVQIMITALAQRMVDKWNGMENKPPFTDYCRQSKQALQKRGINSEHSCIIINKAKELSYASPKVSTNERANKATS